MERRNPLCRTFSGFFECSGRSSFLSLHPFHFISFPFFFCFFSLFSSVAPGNVIPAEARVDEGGERLGGALVLLARVAGLHAGARVRHLHAPVLLAVPQLRAGKEKEKEMKRKKEKKKERKEKEK
jgi:hypothetical protein